MNSEENAISFGRYLKSIRLEQDITLRQIADETRIGMETLILIENEDISKLPAEVFTIGFLRGYAKAIGADGDEAVKRYRSDLEAFQEVKRFDADLFRTTTRFWPRLILSIGALGYIVAISIYLLSGSHKIPLLHSDEKPLETVAEAHTETFQEPKETEAEPPPPSESDKLLLKVKAVKETWMKVIIDGQDTKEYRLNSGDHLELEADTGFNLLVGDAKGIKLTLGEKAVRVPGKDGQVVTVQIP